MIRRFKFTITWSSVIYILLLLPSNDIPNVKFHIPFADKIIHFGLFAILAIAGKFDRIKFWNLIIYGTLTAVVTETLQLLMNAGRHGDFYDFLADITGLFISCLFLKYFYSKKFQKAQTKQP